MNDIQYLAKQRDDKDACLCRMAPCVVQIAVGGDKQRMDVILKGPCYPPGFYVVQDAFGVVMFVYRDQIVLP